MFYTGSWVSRERYAPFLRELGGGSMIMPDSPCAPHPFANASSTEKVYLVGHSLGGFRAALDAMKYPDRVAGLIMINANLNERWKMPYPGIPLARVTVPTLTILAGRDERLPVQRALDDLFVGIDGRHRNHHFWVNRDLGHFSGVADGDPEAAAMITGPIRAFVEGTAAKNMTALRQMTAPLEERFTTHVECLSVTAPIMTSRPCGVVDAILELVMPRCLWEHMHWWYFLQSTPDAHTSYMFEDDHHVMWKGKPGDFERVQPLFATWARRRGATVRRIDLPSVHPSILPYLFLPLFPGKDTLPVLTLRVNDNTTYYKIPHPHRVFGSLPLDSLLP